MTTAWASEVLPLFLELAAIPSPSGEEEAVAEHVRAYLRDLGVETETDTAGTLLARLPATAGAESGTPIFLCAHLDEPAGRPRTGDDGGAHLAPSLRRG